MSTTNPRYGWVIVAASFAIYAVAFSLPFSFGIYFKPLQDTFGWSRATISMAMTLQQIIFALFLVPAGWAIDHVNSRLLFSISAIVVGASVALSSMVQESWQLWLLWGVPLGIGLSAYGPQLMGIVTRWFDEKRGLALGVASAGVGFGTLIGAPTASWLISSYGWRTSLVILGITSGVLNLIAAYFMRSSPDGVNARSPGSHSGTGKQATEGMTFRQAVRTKDLYLLIIAQAGMLFTLKVIQAHIASHAIDVGVAVATAALLVGTIGGLSVVGRVAMGFGQDTWGAKRLLMIGIVGQGLAMLALPLVKTDLSFFAFAVVFGFVYGGDVPQVAALIARRYGVLSIGVIYGLISAAGNLVAGTGPVLAGYVFDVSGSYTPVFLSAALGLFVCFFCVWKLRLRK